MEQQQQTKTNEITTPRHPAEHRWVIWDLKNGTILESHKGRAEARKRRQALASDGIKAVLRDRGY